MQEILKQPQYSPVSLETQIIIIYAGTNGFSDKVSLDEMSQWEADLVRYMETNHPEIGDDIAKEKRITAETEAALRSALEAFALSWEI